MTDYTTPSPNDTATRRQRNKRLSDRLVAASDDIMDIVLETLPSGRTRWTLVFRDGTKEFVN